MSKNQILLRQTETVTGVRGEEIKTILHEKIQK